VPSRPGPICDPSVKSQSFRMTPYRRLRNLGG
jgi:hypothetical protein